MGVVALLGFYFVVMILISAIALYFTRGEKPFSLLKIGKAMTQAIDKLKHTADVEANVFALDVQRCQAFVIDSPDARAILLVACQRMKARASAVREQKASIVDPLKQSIAATDALFAPVFEAEKQIDALVKSKVLAYDREVERQAAVARAAAQQALSQNPTAPLPPTVLAAVAAPSAAPLAGVSKRTTWRAVVENPAILPPEFVIPATPDMAALNKIARESKGSAQVPGVRFVPEETLAIGAK